ncbi:SDR family NAD(P)-dependent oxidoreductase [Pseudoalteromonas piscicida]|uniref:SDR family NAD(P)-dependent oxidoreductase n=1 Tax=Pseudoalteromonas piscicida TaxID=43662 RepID=UPI000E358D3E|nr:SDR family oxidoreductase [Pseudoalteromonas piscicida]AXQ98541.1 SDR family oxidoreductase [Pseudoalteromonas piscicida]
MFTGKTVVVTGVSKGIGKGIALAFLQGGARVYGICRTQTPIVELHKPEYQARFTQQSGNITDSEFVNSAIRQAISDTGRVDVLVNNAGITDDSLFSQMSYDAFHNVLDINFKGTLLCCQAVLPVMTKQGAGKIINMVSQSGISGREGQANYATSKGAIIGLTRTIARQYGHCGIYCNALAPTFIATDMIDDIPASIINPVLKHTALGRVGSVKEIADATLYLASCASNYQTGNVLRLDGGLAV